jgi:uncharacterized protein DUF397
MKQGINTAWRKSTYSNSSANCVEVAAAPACVGVRDSKQEGNGPVLAFSADAWRRFLARAKGGEFDHPAA